MRSAVDIDSQHHSGMAPPGQQGVLRGVRAKDRNLDRPEQ